MAKRSQKGKSGKKVRVGLIGAGNMANMVHYPSLAEMKDVEMVALCDLAEEKLTATAERFGIGKRYANYKDMLEKEKLDAVYVLMPPYHLFDIVIDCLRAKLNVFIEKPPAVTTFQVRAFCREAVENGVVGMVGFNRRYIPMLTYAKAAVEQKTTINQVVATFYKDSSAVYYNGAVDVIGCDAIHAVDAVRWMAGGEVLDVASVISRNDDVVPNAWNVLVSFDNGVAGVVLTNWATGGRTHTFEMHGRGASAFLNPDDKGVIVAGTERETIDTKEIAGSSDTYKYYGFFAQARHFIDCVQKGDEPSSSFEDALGTMQLVDMIRELTILSPTPEVE